MWKIKASSIIQLFLILIYFIQIVFSVFPQPIYLILGILCILFFPGYNLLNLLKPQFNLIEKLGYIIIISIAIINVMMFFIYIIFYDKLIGLKDQGFFFEPKPLISIFIILNLLLIIIYELKNKNFKKSFNSIYKQKLFNNFNLINKKEKYRNLIFFLIFFIFLILLCISTLYSNVPENNNYITNYYDYRSNFTFFLRVPFIFYVFLILVIISLVYIFIYSKNHFFILTCISIFLYCLWILPYLQIGNYFNHDSFLLKKTYEDYLINGIQVAKEYNFFIKNIAPLRYSTGLFTTIILITSTNTTLDIALWYLFPLIYSSFPFFSYSAFKRFQINIKGNNNQFILVISTIFALFTPIFLGTGHTAGTGIIGTIVFFILSIEFFNLIYRKEKKKKIIDFFLIAFLYLFLCLTHFEECIYFLILIVLYSFFYLFSNLKNIKGGILYQEKQNNNFITFNKSSNKNIKIRNLKFFLIIIGILLFVLSLIFYLITEFFGWLKFYYNMSFRQLSFLDPFFNIYLNSKISNPFSIRSLPGFSYFAIIVIIIVILLILFVYYILIFKFYNFLIKISIFFISILKKMHNFLKKIVSSKIFTILFFPFMFILTIIINLLFLPPRETNFIILAITLILSYIISIFQIYLAFKGIGYYKIQNYKQNYFLIALMSSSIIIIIFFLFGEFFISIYVFHTKYLSYFVFFNLFLIQDNYLREFQNMKKNKLLFFSIILLLLGSFYSLRALGLG